MISQTDGLAGYQGDTREGAAQDVEMGTRIRHVSSSIAVVMRMTGQQADVVHLFAGPVLGRVRNGRVIWTTAAVGRSVQAVRVQSEESFVR